MRYYSSVAQPATLTSAVNSSATSINVNTTTGWPLTSPFTLVIDAGTETEELVTVTAVSGLVVTVERGADGTAAVEHIIAAPVRHAISARDFREPQEHIDASTNVHGVGSGSAVVGTLTVQAIKNKDIDGEDNTLTNIPQSAVTDLVTALSGKQAAGDYATSAELDAAIATRQIAGSYAAASHNHNDVYYTKTEVDAKTWDASDIASGELDAARYGTASAFYTPSFTGLTIGNSTVVAKWSRVGDNIKCAGQVTLGSLFSVTASITVSTPAAIGGVHNSNYCSLGSGMLTRTGISAQAIMPTPASANAFYLRKVTGEVIGASEALNTGDVISWNISYERAV